MKRVTLVDYGAGNMGSVQRALEHIGATVDIASSTAGILAAPRLILPGVGAFKGCMQELETRGLIDPVLEFAVSGKPLLGICVGMQMLFDSSEEFGESNGLGLISGEVLAIPDTGIDGRKHKIPHIGWAPLRPASGAWEGGLMKGISPLSEVYFVHSFTAHPANPKVRLADSDYDGRPIAGAVHVDNIWGCQFHPEKSGPIGLRILQNFLDL